ncbi:MAG TPA: YggS family pyridoxal phosphate-dependent enzyme [Dongiaceae bacterium]|nr:YggS family pyridoxal phosphate-dependent enzyme [Dongiaceae bacterium]
MKERVAAVRERIAHAAQRSGRRAEDVTLIAVAKTHPAEAIAEAFALGVRHFGENRVQEWEGKRAGVEGLDAQWHLIGHLQSNKAARAARLFSSVDSVDDFALAQRLDRARAEAGLQKLRVLIEVRVAPEETKSGVDPSDLHELVERLLELERLELRGFLCIPPFLEDAEQVRPYFVRLRELKEGAEVAAGQRLPVLSMGMSHDFAVAIEEGATEVRVGTALFGARG